MPTKRMHQQIKECRGQVVASIKDNFLKNILACNDR